jgi:carbon storage regulator
MLMMSRREGETILIGDDIEIVIAHIGRSRVKVGIQAPRQLSVVAQEVKLVRDENLAAAADHSGQVLSELLAKLRPRTGALNREQAATSPSERSPGHPQ